MRKKMKKMRATIGRIVFNLRNARFIEFLKLDPWKAIPDIYVKLRNYKKLKSRTVRQRYKICLNCPIRDPELNSCSAIHPETGEEFGCGCYIPYLIQVDQECWLGEENGGWGTRS